VTDNSDCTRIVPTKRHKNSALEFHLVRMRLHVLSDIPPQMALVGNTYVGPE
jgi:hypothetical protein